MPSQRQPLGNLIARAAEQLLPAETGPSTSQAVVARARELSRAAQSKVKDGTLMGMAAVVVAAAAEEVAPAAAPTHARLAQVGGFRTRGKAITALTRLRNVLGLSRPLSMPTIIAAAGLAKDLSAPAVALLAAFKDAYIRKMPKASPEDVRNELGQPVVAGAAIAAATLAQGRTLDTAGVRSLATAVDVTPKALKAALNSFSETLPEVAAAVAENPIKTRKTGRKPKSSATTKTTPRKRKQQRAQKMLESARAARGRGGKTKPAQRRTTTPVIQPRGVAPDTAPSRTPRRKRKAIADDWTSNPLLLNIRAAAAAVTSAHAKRRKLLGEAGYSADDKSTIVVQPPLVAGASTFKRWALWQSA
ncbi:uncharacterized protein AMSG_03251 [Thecamonas trahens ATCC 50062]|uniref:Uncharacterized protein n=1 Tax=Thecamonas trahens ATCC 50062 TaxID=461836 RepID=A0A0L0D3L6_THETB|nr:hypothetical protein AMSG_03251 [Thecamonas trahens ATCC 50062]KNC46820.1 hypothetical protein AMSG_03251 [Thecamonas trahens ATCC 50062]|eukprot:XP_013760095.1 hypothetical protein AMSG_03251 [Thecamonas trahens ATCC 50062]